MLITERSMWVRDHLMRLPRSRIQGDNLLILCPFHSERTPSCSVSLGAKAPPGVFLCWGCKVRGTWSKLATELGLPGFPGSGDAVTDIDLAMMRSRSDRIMGGDPDSTPRHAAWAAIEPMLRGCPLLDPDGAFGSVSREFLIRFGCRKALHPDTGEPFLVVPGNVHGAAQCLVRARLRRGKGAKYLTSRGGAGVVGLDEAIDTSKFKKHRVLLAVEGPKDAMAFLQSGFPAVSLCGTSLDDRKMELLAGTEPVGICLIFDNDAAGERASESIMSRRSPVPVTRVTLPPKSDVGYKIDPADLSKRQHRVLYRGARATLGVG